MAALHSGSDATFFVEKFTSFAESSDPARSVPAMIAELYPGAREIVLIRDLRDVVCSISAFTKKYAYATNVRTKRPSATRRSALLSS